MRVGVDAWRLQGRRTGVGTYLSRVLSHWDRELLPAGTEVTLYSPTALEDSEPALPSNLRRRIVGPAWDMLPWQTLRLGPAASDDVLFCPSYAAPLATRTPTVVVIFEATQRLFAAEYDLRTRLLYSPVYGLSGRRASVVISTTAAARDDVARAYRIPAERIRVVPLAPAELFRPIDGEAARVEARVRVLGDERPFFLHVGKMTRRRNVPTLLRAFARFKKCEGTDHRLVVVGLRTTDLDTEALASELGVKGDFTHLEYIPSQDLADLYASADAFVLPYTYEALSLTALEAQAAGAPVVTTDTPGLRDQTGEAALFLDGVSEAALAEALGTLVRDPSLGERLRRDGLAHASSFSWRATARQTFDVLADVAGRAGAA